MRYAKKTWRTWGELMNCDHKSFTTRWMSWREAKAHVRKLNIKK